MFIFIFDNIIMQFTSVVVHLFLFGFTVYMVKGQETVITGGEIEVGRVNETEVGGVNETEVEEVSTADEPSSAWAILQTNYTLESFVSLLRRNGQPVSVEDLFTVQESAGGKEYITPTGGRMAAEGGCSPRDTVVSLQLPTDNPLAIYYPSCTIVKRCGGGCHSANVDCVPLYTERERLSVLKAEFPYAGAPTLTYDSRPHSVIVTQHVTCQIRCNLNAEKCGPKKNFNSEACDCKCKNYERCQPPHVWDPDECACTCAETTTCCRDSECCGLRFNRQTCECEVDTGKVYIHGSSIPQEIIDEYLARQNSANSFHGVEEISIIGASPSAPTTSSMTTTTATTTTTTTTTTEGGPCAAVNCPWGFSIQQNADGMCVCRPSRRHRFGRVQRRSESSGEINTRK